MYLLTSQKVTDTGIWLQVQFYSRCGCWTKTIEQRRQADEHEFSKNINVVQKHKKDKNADKGEGSIKEVETKTEGKSVEEKQKEMAEAKVAEEASQRMNISRKMIFICVLPGTVCVYFQHKHPDTPTLCPVQ